jgi:hypothetical protein
VLSLLVLWAVVSMAGLIGRYSACLGGYGSAAGRALTLVGGVQPGNVDAVDLVHVRGGCHRVCGCDVAWYRQQNARARAFEQQ